MNGIRSGLQAFGENILGLGETFLVPFVGLVMMLGIGLVAKTSKKSRNL